mgnify:FL=1
MVAGPFPCFFPIPQSRELTIRTTSQLSSVDYLYQSHLDAHVLSKMSRTQGNGAAPMYGRASISLHCGRYLRGSVSITPCASSSVPIKSRGPLALIPLSFSLFFRFVTMLFFLSLLSLAAGAAAAPEVKSGSTKVLGTTISSSVEFFGGEPMLWWIVWRLGC